MTSAIAGKLPLIAAVLVGAIAGSRLVAPVRPPLPYRVVLAPSADPSLIGLDFTSAKRIEIDGAGDVVVTAGARPIRLHPPPAFQEVRGVRRSVRLRFELAPNGDIRLIPSEYDRSRPLVIDPFLD